MTAQTITTVLDAVAEWVELNIAPKLEYLTPGEDGAEYDIDVRTSNPSVYQGFVPGKERLAEGDVQAPSITVQLLDGKDDKTDGRSLGIRLALVVWAPGHFDGESFYRDTDGWRDLYNGLDTIANAVEAAEVIGGYTVDQSSGVKFGFVEIDGEVPDLYPYWLGKVDFYVNGGVPATKRFESLL